MTVDDVLFFLGLIGVGVLLVGVVIANVAVFRMQCALNREGAIEKHVSPWLVIGKGSYRYHPVLKYEEHFGDDLPLPRLRRNIDWLIYPGAVIGLGSLLIEKFRR